MQNLHSFLVAFLPTLALFLFSLITYWMREEVYRAWFKFVRWSIPLSMFLIFITPEYAGGLINPFQKGGVAFMLTITFSLVSILIILIKHFSRPR